MAARYPGKVAFVSEDLGASKLAERFGVKGYPAVFVDDVLVARPRDFGYFGEGNDTKRYAPWRKAESQAKFKADLTRMVEMALAGKQAQLAAERRAATSGESDQIAAMPKFALMDLAGRPLKSEELVGKTVLVEFWATWCPPCQSTLEWLGKLKQRYGDDVVVVAMAVESEDAKVKATVAKLSPEIRWAISDAPTAQAFGDVAAVPTMYLFDKGGKTAKVLYGAPPDLHETVEKALEGMGKTAVSN